MARRSPKTLRIANRNEAIKAAIDIDVKPLITAASRMEDAHLVRCDPEEVYELGRPLAKVPAPERIQGSVEVTRREPLKLQEQPTVGIEDAEAAVYKYVTHFRRGLKAQLLNDKISRR